MASISLTNPIDAFENMARRSARIRVLCGSDLFLDSICPRDAQRRAADKSIVGGSSSFVRFLSLLTNPKLAYNRIFF
jgi:hypothetical protein